MESAVLPAVLSQILLGIVICCYNPGAVLQKAWYCCALQDHWHNGRTGTKIYNMEQVKWKHQGSKEDQGGQEVVDLNSHHTHPDPIPLCLTQYAQTFL